MKTSKLLLILVFIINIFSPVIANAEATIIEDKVEIVKARVVEVLKIEKKETPGTGVQSTYQTIQVQVLEGDKKGQLITVENDFLALKAGDRFFLRHSIDGTDGREMYSVRDIDRRGAVLFFVALFIGVVLFF